MIFGRDRCSPIHRIKSWIAFRSERGIVLAGQAPTIFSAMCRMTPFDVGRQCPAKGRFHEGIRFRFGTIRLAASCERNHCSPLRNCLELLSLHSNPQKTQQQYPPAAPWPAMFKQRLHRVGVSPFSATPLDDETDDWQIFGRSDQNLAKGRAPPGDRPWPAAALACLRLEASARRDLLCAECFIRIHPAGRLAGNQQAPQRRPTARSQRTRT